MPCKWMLSATNSLFARCVWLGACLWLGSSGATYAAEPPPLPGFADPTAKECKVGETDACTEGLVCVEVELPSCPESPKDPAATDAGPGCTMKLLRRCVPRYMAPCTKSADCGEGFDCVEEKVCTCAGADLPPHPPPPGSLDGSASAWLMDGGPEALPDGCTCIYGDKKRCQLRQVPCESDEACPEGLTCAEAPKLDCKGADRDGGLGCEQPMDDPGRSERYCAPPAGAKGAAEVPKQLSADGGSGAKSSSGETSHRNSGDADDAKDTSVEGGGGGCVITGRAAAGSAPCGALGLLGIALSLARRRHRA